MSDSPSASEECFSKGRQNRRVDLHVVVPSASEPGVCSLGAPHRDLVSAGRARQTCLPSGKIGYYADFAIYGMIVVALVAFTLRGTRSDRLIWLAAAIAGAGGWTLVEYFLHRFVLHRMPLIADLHHAHHAAPRAYVSTPTWASLPVLAGVFFAPMWRLFSLNVAFGAIDGLITGWLWYGVVHHVIHYRRPRQLAVALRVASHRHFLHHSPYLSGNFGVTTAVWDHLFGTHLSSGARATGDCSRER
jgi:sterol desaturase/sphingolipid hydroxylase (fatty acid hydroxylase superfamily)